VNSLTSLGPFSTPSLRTQNLNTEQLNCDRLISDHAEFPSIPPPSFYQLASPPASTVEQGNELSAQMRESRARARREDEEAGFRSSDNEEGQPITASMQLMLSETDSDVIIKPIRTSTSSTSMPVVPYPSAASAPAVTECDDIINLSVRLGRAVMRTTWQGLQAMADYIEAIISDDPTKVEEQRANLKALLCILIVFVAGIILTTRSGSSSTKWEFYMPPPDL